MPANRFMPFFIAMLVCSGPLRAEDKSPAMARAEIEKIVREYILQHPEVLMESVQAHRDKERLEAQRRSSSSVAANRRDLFGDPSSPVLGDAGAEVAIVQFFDYRCGYCRRMAPVLTELLEKHKNVRVIVKELPILGPESHLAARAALAAGKQGSYAAFHQKLIGLNGPITTAVLEQTAGQLGLDPARLRADMSSPEVATALVRNQGLANVIGVQATPSFVIGNELVSGAMDLTRFEDLISKGSR